GPVAPDIIGWWFSGGWPCNITRTGPDTYDLQSEHGDVFHNGRLVSNTEIDAWNTRGIISEAGGRMVITWENGTYWVRPSTSSSTVPPQSEGNAQLRRPRSARQVHLCDLKETHSSVGVGVLGKNGDLGYDPGVGDGNPVGGDRRIIVKGVLAKKGLSMHSTAP